MVTIYYAEPSWLIQTEFERDRNQEKNGLHYFMLDIPTATYVGTYTLALYSPSSSPDLATCAWTLYQFRLRPRFHISSVCIRNQDEHNIKTVV